MLPPEQHKHTHNWDHWFCDLLFYSTVNMLYIPFLELHMFHCKDIPQFNNQSSIIYLGHLQLFAIILMK